MIFLTARKDFSEREKGKDYIRALIYVERKSQKGILIGKKGEALKKVGAEARKEIENFLGREVYLELWVKVKEKWRKDKKFLKELGY
jgi:GTP-binding protein Era